MNIIQRSSSINGGGGNKLLGGLGYYLILSYEKLYFKVIDALVVVNEHMKHQLLSDKVPIYVLPNYPSSVFTKNNSFQKKVNLKSNTLIYVGGLDERRNIYKLISILALIHSDSNIKASLAIYGRGSKDYLNKLKEHSEELGIQDYVSFGVLNRDEVYPVLQQAAIGMFLLTGDEVSHSWGEPIKFFEYAAASLPVIMSDLPAKRRLVEIFQNGYVVNPDDEEGIAKKCAYLLKNPAKSEVLGEAGKACFYQKYHWEAVEPEINKMFQFLKS